MQAHEETARALRERVKELSCLYRIHRLCDGCFGPAEEVFRHIVELIPQAWQYPEIAAARIVLDGTRYASPGFKPGRHRLTSAMEVGGKRRGLVEVVYTEDRPELDEGPFLQDERTLLDVIAGQIAAIVEHQEAEEERGRLHKQLVHADRLATIGQLAAGVAHELNEPLSSILGFAQLLDRDPDIPPRARRDIRNIVTASLHARDIIKQLLLFARQAPVVKASVELNDVISAAIEVFKHQFEKEGIELVCVLSPELPTVQGDRGQLTQVLINLVVNAVQAMPDGGTLTVRTQRQDGQAVCTVEDTGTGMSEEVMDRLFVPFFTTKEVNQGTGLGLAVVHGLVASHGGTIQVASTPGSGTTFTIRLPIETAAQRPCESES